MKLTPFQRDQLIGLNHEPLTRGEILLLAKAASAAIPLAGPEVTHIKQYVMSYKQKIRSAMDFLYNYTYISDEDSSYLDFTIQALYNWRHSIAYGTDSVVFTGNNDMLIDEFTTITRYLSCDQFHSLLDVEAPAMWYEIFVQVVKYHFAGGE